MGDSNKEKCNYTEVRMQPKLKILALHGDRQNAETFKQKTSSFRRIVRKWAEFTYITAPNKVILMDDMNQTDDIAIGQSHDEEEQYGWFFNGGIRKGGPAIGFEESVKFVETVYQKEGPFDGILGFSQGACFVGLLCDLQQRGLINCKFDFAIMASGCKSTCLPHLKYFSEIVTMPSLHIFGENDKIISTERSEALSSVFLEPEVVRHPGGHYLPATGAQKNAYRNFFKKRHLQKHKSADDKV